MNFGFIGLHGAMLCFTLLTLCGYASNALAGINDDLLAAAEAGNVKEVSRLLDEGADVNYKDKDGDTPFHAAARWGRKDFEEQMDARMAEVAVKLKIDATPRNTISQKRNAITQGHKNVAKLLIAKGADVNAKGKDGSTPLHLAAIFGQDIAKRLIAKGASVNVKNNSGETPLMLAAFMGLKNLVNVLIACGADVYAVGRVDEGGLTVLHAVTFMGHKDIAELLIGKGANVNAMGENGITPLQIAATFGDKRIAELLIAKGAQIDTLHIAALLGRKDIAKQLIAKGADINAKSSGASQVS